MFIVVDSSACTQVVSTTDFKMGACCFYGNIAVIICKYTDNIQSNLYYDAFGTMNNFLIRQVTFKYMWRLKRGDHMAGLTVWSKEVIAWQVWLYDQKKWSHGRFDYDQKRWSHGRFDLLTMIKRGDCMAGLTVWSKEVIAWQVW